jgi:excisionase family DNA binding protein
MNEKRGHQDPASELGSPAALGTRVAGDADALLTAEDVARLLSVDVSWVRAQTRAGAIPVVALPGRWRRYRRASVVAWVEKLERPGRPVRLRSVPPPKGPA